MAFSRITKACILFAARSATGEATSTLEVNRPEDREKLVKKLLAHYDADGTYNAEEYAKVAEGLSAQEVKELDAGEVTKAPRSTKQIAIRKLSDADGMAGSTEGIGSMVDKAVGYAEKVNRGLVLANELRTGVFFTTYGMPSQLSILALLFAGIDKLRKSFSKAGSATRPLNFLLGGCGVGDWAVETALYEAEHGAPGPKITCWNFSQLSTRLGKDVFLKRPIREVYDRKLLTTKERKAPEDIQFSSKPSTRLVQFQFTCTAPNQEGCEGPGLRTSQPDAFLKHFGTAQESSGSFLAGAKRLVRFRTPDFHGKADVIAYGNALLPSELENVRAALRDDASFAIVPVCLNQYYKADAGAAGLYCEGAYWKVRKSRESDEGPYHTFPAVMRPQQTTTLVSGVEDYAPQSWKPTAYLK